MPTESPRQIVPVGASGGIGRAMLAELVDRFPETELHATGFRGPIPFQHPRVDWRQLDLLDDRAIADWSAGFEGVDWMLSCAGFLHGDAGWPEKTVRSPEAKFLLENIRVNTLPSLLLARHFDAAFRRSGAPLLATASARVGSIEDNRFGGWSSYRVSKAALDKALKSPGIEWRHRSPEERIVALHPGTNDAALSKPCQAKVKPENPFDPASTAASFVSLLERLEPSSNGNFRAWDGELLPW